jgi:hypothetical protein
VFGHADCVPWLAAMGCDVSEHAEHVGQGVVGLRGAGHRVEFGSPVTQVGRATPGPVVKSTQRGDVTADDRQYRGYYPISGAHA